MANQWWTASCSTCSRSFSIHSEKAPAYPRLCGLCVYPENVIQELTSAVLAGCEEQKLELGTEVERLRSALAHVAAEARLIARAWEPHTPMYAGRIRELADYARTALSEEVKEHP
jgi:hypothetical protein